MHAAALADRIDAALPQTQCRRCGYGDCRAYAEAIADEGAPINRCPPGGRDGVARLAALTGRPEQPLDPACGEEGPRRVARIDEDWCIGCTLCIKACPVDAVVGAAKRMHSVVDDACTGCDLCVPACPVDCISMVDAGVLGTGWQAWSPAAADTARARYASHRMRVEREAREQETRLAERAAAKLADLARASRLQGAALEAKRAVVEAALARARAKRAGDRAR